MSWNKMSEVGRPAEGFMFSCPKGHEWFVALKEYFTRLYDEQGNHLPNDCQECADEHAKAAMGSDSAE